MKRTLMLAAIVSHVFAIGLAVLDFAPEYAEYRRFAAFALIGIGFAASVFSWLTRRRLAGSSAWRRVVFFALCGAAAYGVLFVVTILTAPSLGVGGNELVKRVETSAGIIYVYEFSVIPDGFKSTEIKMRRRGSLLMRELLSVPCRLSYEGVTAERVRFLLEEDRSDCVGRVIVDSSREVAERG